MLVVRLDDSARDSFTRHVIDAADTPPKKFRLDTIVLSRSFLPITVEAREGYQRILRVCLLGCIALQGHRANQPNTSSKVKVLTKDNPCSTSALHSRVLVRVAWCRLFAPAPYFRQYGS